VSLDEPVSLVDTHCHLYLDEYDQDRSQVIKRAWEAGIRRLLIPGLDIETSKAAIKCASEYQQVCAAAGLHPNSNQKWTEDTQQELRSLAKKNKVVAIGEIGLDYYRNHSPHDYQRRSLIKQLELAADLEIPVIIHNREASGDIADILTDWQGGLTTHHSHLSEHPGVLHAFSGDEQLAERMAELHFKLGIGGAVTFRNSHILQRVVKVMPLQCLLLETDAPFLSPHPLRGQRNEPVNVRIVAEKIAEIKAMPVGEVGRITTEEADKVFNWRPYIDSG